MTTFEDLGLSEKALAAVGRLGYDSPTPVQAQAIPLALKGRDVIAAAKTGTGKTAAFSLPSMDTLGHIQHGQGPLMLVVTPTRELAMQIGEVCSTIAKATHHRIATVVGGVSYEPQKKQLKSGVDVLIATPGRLIDLMEQQAVKLKNVEVLVLDEADRMLDMGFWPSVKKIAAATSSTRQTLLFSATIDRAIVDNSGALLRDPAYVEIAHRGETADTVDQYIIKVAQAAKPELLKAVLKEKGGTRIIVFARTRSRADSNTRRLKRAGFSAEAIHSDRSQAQRKRALDNFTKGKTDILVATDVLARGIDVSEVNYVINFDLPNQPEDYVHRIGRTGRAGETGFSISFVSPEQEEWLRDIEKLIKREIPVMPFDFDFEEAEAQGAARATAWAAKRDPELAAAVNEHQKREKRRKKKALPNKKQGGAEAASQKQSKQQASKSSGKQTPGSGAKPGDKRPKKSQKKSSNAPEKQPQKKSSSDLRPGRAYRAAIAKKRKSTSRNKNS